MAIDWTKNLKKFKGLWVALKDDQKTVIASGKTVQTAVEKAKKNGFKDPILFRVPEKIIPYIGKASPDEV